MAAEAPTHGEAGLGGNGPMSPSLVLHLFPGFVQYRKVYLIYISGVGISRIVYLPRLILSKSC